MEVTTALNAALDVFLVRKLGRPGQEELPMGAIATGGVLIINEEIVERERVPDQVAEAVVAREIKELEL